MTPEVLAFAVTCAGADRVRGTERVQLVPAILAPFYGRRPEGPAFLGSVEPYAERTSVDQIFENHHALRVRTVPVSPSCRPCRTRKV